MRILNSWVLVGVMAGFTGCGTMTEPLRPRPPGVPVSLGGSERTAHIDVFFRSGSTEVSTAKRIADAAEAKLAGICSKLNVKNDVRYALCIFANWAELDAAKDDRVSDADPRMVRLNAGDGPTAIESQMARAVISTKLGAIRGEFYLGGLAEALRESPRGVPADTIVKLYRAAGALPRVAGMNAPFNFSGLLNEHQSIDAYPVCESWMRFLFKTHGMQKLARFYAGESFEICFGASLENEEKAWWSALDNYVPSPREQKLAVARYGSHSPTRLTFFVDESFTIGVSATKDPRPGEVRATLVWSKDGVVLPNEIGFELAREHVGLADSGSYEVEIRDGVRSGRGKYEITVIDPVEFMNR